jgi:hypothetical protein
MSEPLIAAGSSLINDAGSIGSALITLGGIAVGVACVAVGIFAAIKHRGLMAAVGPILGGMLVIWLILNIGNGPALAGKAIKEGSNYTNSLNKLQPGQ